MLIHLDVKEGGIEKDLADLFDAFDMWDHLVEVNAGNAITIRHNARVDLLAYKGGWGKGDYSMDQIKALMARSGDMIFCEYPGEAAKKLNRKHGTETPIPTDLRTWWTPAGPIQIESDRQ
jgi:hypothetical protein